MLSLTIDPAIAGLIVTSAMLLFASAALHKLRDLRRFREVFAAYGLLPVAARPTIAAVVPLLEAGVAGALLFSATRAAGAAVGILLLLAYAGAIAINLGRGRNDLACGCGGPDERRPIAAWMVWRNLVISLVLAPVMLPWSTRSLELTDAVTIGLGSLTCALVYACVDRVLGHTARRTAQLRAQ